MKKALLLRAALAAQFSAQAVLYTTNWNSGFLIGAGHSAAVVALLRCVVVEMTISSDQGSTGFGRSFDC